MMSWLAQQYNTVAANLLIFLENPTDCGWIAWLRGPAFLLGVLLLARFAYLVLAARHYGRRGRVSHSLSPVAERALGSATDVMRKMRSSVLWRVHLRSIASRRVRILDDDAAVLCTVGFLRPRVLVSRGALENMEAEELSAAFAHELAHILYFDNLKRALLEAACLAAPITTWWIASRVLVTASSTRFFAVTYLGLMAGLAMRLILMPAMKYWQERRCDELAGLAFGDRLLVASALLSFQRIASHPRRQPPFPASMFAFFTRPFSRRVRSLSHTGPPWVLRMDLWSRRVGTPLWAGSLALVLLVASQSGPVTLPDFYGGAARAPESFGVVERVCQTTCTVVNPTRGQ
jgi:Zn-dependent protease with chaperone function